MRKIENIVRFINNSSSRKSGVSRLSFINKHIGSRGSSIVSKGDVSGLNFVAIRYTHRQN